MNGKHMHKISGEVYLPPSLAMRASITAAPSRYTITNDDISVMTTFAALLLAFDKLRFSASCLWRRNSLKSCHVFILFSVFFLSSCFFISLLLVV